MAQTISAKYLRLQQELHRNPDYGVASVAFAPIVATICQLNAIRSISDYGSGKQRLRPALVDNGVILEAYHPYDPAFPEAGEPTTAPLVCCIDVLEHVEPACLDAVLQELASLVSQLAFVTIHTGPAIKRLADGRNAHLIQAPPSWWLPKICSVLEVLHLEMHDQMGHGFWLLLAPKQQFPLIDGQPAGDS